MSTGELLVMIVSHCILVGSISSDFFVSIISLLDAWILSILDGEALISFFGKYRFDKSD